MRSSARAIALWSAGAVLPVILLVAASHVPGPQSKHMGLHIFLMNVAAPLFAVFAASRSPFSATRAVYFWTTALAQVALLWLAHAPAIQNLALLHPAFQLSIHGALLLSAFLFWMALITLHDRARWQGLLALALTGKLICLLAALLVFAPRTLYGAKHQHGPDPLLASAGLDDQHFAGLMMMAACPLSYMVAAIVLAVRLVIPDRKPEALAHIPG
jgi:putative membrane protein